MALTPADQQLLEFVVALPNPTSREAQAKLHARFGNVTQAWQRINAVLDTEDALALNPVMVGHLRRLRQVRRDLRARRTPSR